MSDQQSPHQLVIKYLSLMRENGWKMSSLKDNDAYYLINPSRVRNFMIEFETAQYNGRVVQILNIAVTSLRTYLEKKKNKTQDEKNDLAYLITNQF